MDRLRIAMGDIHSYFSVLPQIIATKKLKDCDIYHVGDFGVGFISKEQEFKNLDYINKLLIERDIKLFVNFGNHEDPAYWKEQLYRTDNIYFVPSYTVLDGVLFLGGAISIDRLYRIANQTDRQKLWWADEKFEYNPIVKELTGIEYVISHSCPDFCQPLQFSSMVWEFIEEEKKAGLFTLETELKEERRLLTQIYTELSQNNKIKKQLMGHMHRSSYLYHNDTEFIGLAINEIKEF